MTFAVIAFPAVATAIHTADRNELIGFISDTYKDIYGVRPRFKNFGEMTLPQLDAYLNDLCEMQRDYDPYYDDYIAERESYYAEMEQKKAEMEQKKAEEDKEALALAAVAPDWFDQVADRLEGVR